MNKERKYKVFVVGLATSYASWIQGSLTKNMEEADVVLFTGGEDISPKLYNGASSRTVHLWDRDNKSGLPRRDLFELEAYKEAIKLNKPIWGTCRGAQLLCAMAGGKLVQDVSHGGSHSLFFYDNEFTCSTNSLHHQLQYPYPIPEEEYQVLAWAKGLSPYFTGGEDKPMHMPERTYSNGRNLVKEPEFVYYSKIRGLGIQGHPEMMNDTSPLVVVCHAFLNLLIEDKLKDVLKLNLKVENIIQRAWDFEFTAREVELLSKARKRELEVEVESSVIE